VVLLWQAGRVTTLHLSKSFPRGRFDTNKDYGFNYAITKHTATVELYIDRGKDTEEENKSIFQQLADAKEEVEQAFGEPLEWQQPEGKRACRIRKRFALGGYRDDEEKWSQIHEAMVDAMICLEKALKPQEKNEKISEFS
jgi:hypothetical protein